MFWPANCQVNQALQKHRRLLDWTGCKCFVRKMSVRFQIYVIRLALCLTFSTLVMTTASHSADIVPEAYRKNSVSGCTENWKRATWVRGRCYYFCLPEKRFVAFSTGTRHPTSSPSLESSQLTEGISSPRVLSAWQTGHFAWGFRLTAVKRKSLVSLAI